MIRQFLSILLCAGLVLGLTACGGDKSENYIFEYDISEKVTTIDPQFATSSASRMVILNTFEGLLVRSENGSLESGVATDYQVSSDRLKYTFTLRSDARWSNDQPVTAADFVFALKRLFDPQSPSPYAQELRCIQGAQAILGGELSVDRLGVRAIDSQTLVIELEYPNPDLPLLLSESFAMPCNERFFLDQKGRYGLDQKTTLFNGPFVIKKLDNTQSINLRQNADYRSQRPTLATGVNLYVGRQDPIELFMDGKSDAAIVSNEDLERVVEMGGSTQGIPDTVWALLCNQKEPQLGTEDIRIPLMTAVDTALVQTKLTGDAALTGDLIPPSVMVGERSYRDLVGPLPPLPSQSLPLRQVFESGLASLERTKLSKTDLLVLDNRMVRNVAGTLQQSWQRELNAYINVQPLDQTALLTALNTGEFQMILAPFSADNSKADSILMRFTSDASNPLGGVNNPVIDGLMELASQSKDATTAAQYHYQAESLLKESCTVLPLYTTSTYYACAPGVTGIQFISPQGGALFKYAQKS